MKRFLWILPLLCSLPLHAAQQIHKWVDSKGVVHFSDRLSEGAQDSNVQMTIIDTATGTEKANSAKSGTIESNPINDAAREAVESYTLALTSPASGETVRENSGLVTIKANLKPIPMDPFKMNVILDGDLKGTAENALDVKMENVDRGMHQLEVQVTDQNGKLLASSSKTTFYLFRVSVLSKPQNQAKPKVNGAAG